MASGDDLMLGITPDAIHIILRYRDITPFSTIEVQHPSKITDGIDVVARTAPDTKEVLCGATVH